MKKKKKNNQGFTLIELLIVIGLLGALTALILPSLSANREEALGDVCDYNQAGTVRTLNQYNNLLGVFPDDMHNGMTAKDNSALAMPGLPNAQNVNMGDGATIPTTTLHSLTAEEVASLAEAGIDSICSGDGLDSDAIAVGTHVAVAVDWVDDGGDAYSFDGITLANWQTGTGTPSWDQDATGVGKTGTVICLWIAPTVNWSAGDAGNNDWTKGNVELGIALEGQCPIPTAGLDGDADFAYYMAYFKVYSDGTTAARLLGTSCPECGIMNP